MGAGLSQLFFVAAGPHVSQADLQHDWDDFELLILLRPSPKESGLQVWPHTLILCGAKD